MHILEMYTSYIQIESTYNIIIHLCWVKSDLTELNMG